MNEQVAVKGFDLSDSQSASQFNLAAKDLISSLFRWRLWMHLAWTDIKQRYRGSILGPFWITASMLIFVAAFSVVYSRLFHQPLKTYIPFFTAGYLVWMLISTSLTDSCNTFIEAKNFITEIKLPFALYVYRLMWRHFVIFLHNAVIYVGVVFIFHVNINWNILYFIPGLALVLMNLVAIGLLLSMLGAKYRDIPPVIISIIQVTFFVSPITWLPKLIGKGSIVIKLNPVTYFLDLVRSPLLGQVPTEASWLVAITLTSIVFVAAFIIFAKFRNRIAYWI